MNHIEVAEGLARDADAGQAGIIHALLAINESIQEQNNLLAEDLPPVWSEKFPTWINEIQKLRPTPLGPQIDSNDLGL